MAAVSSSGLSLWPKLALWGSVILIGVLYLGSVERKREGHEDGQQVDASAQKPPAFDASRAGGQDAASAVVVEQVRGDTRATAETIAPGEPAAPPATLQPTAPVQEVPAAPADRLPAAHTGAAMVGPAPSEIMGSSNAPERAPASVTPRHAPASAPAGVTPGPAPASAPAGVTPGPAPASARAGVTPGPAPASAPPGVTTEPAPVQTEEGPLKPPPVQVQAAAEPPGPVPSPAEVTPAEAEAFAKAIVSEPSEAQAEAQPSARAEPAGRAVPAAPVQLARPLPAGETLEERRARIMAEYRAIQRRAQEEMRRRWGQSGVPAPPYGYPGYPVYPGYPPGYRPQR